MLVAQSVHARDTSMLCQYNHRQELRSPNRAPRMDSRALGPTLLTQPSMLVAQTVHACPLLARVFDGWWEADYARQDRRGLSTMVAQNGVIQARRLAYRVSTVVARRAMGEPLDWMRMLSTLVAPLWRWANLLPALLRVHAGSTRAVMIATGEAGQPVSAGPPRSSTLVAPSVHAPRMVMTRSHAWSRATRRPR